MDQVNLLVAINAGTLIAIISFGWKVMRFINTIEFQTDILWKDYQERVRRRFVEEGE